MRKNFGNSSYVDEYNKRFTETVPLISKRIFAGIYSLLLFFANYFFMPLLYLFTKAKNLLHRLVFRHFGFGNRVPKTIWEKQFNTGAWDYLESKNEAQHYQAIIKFFDQLKSKKSVLDIGCGKGVLYKYLKENGSLPGIEYRGIDLSENATSAAIQRFPGINFQQLDFEKNNVEKKFDVIIFNESLYYFPLPLRILDKCYSQNLNDNGVFIISMFDYPGHNEIWQKIAKHYQVIMAEEVKNDNGEKWKIKLLQK